MGLWCFAKDDASLEMCELGLMSEMGTVGFTNGNKSIKIVWF